MSEQPVQLDGEDCVCLDVAAMAASDGHDLVPVVLGLLARGRPVSIAEIADAAGAEPAAVEAFLGSEPGADWDESGALVGLGLSLKETPHRFVVEDRVLYTWCAMDTLFFPVVLGTSARAESTCPATGVLVSVELSPDEVVSVTPPAAVVSQVSSIGAAGDLRASVCDHGHFFASAEAAADWLAGHPGGQVIGVRAAFAGTRSGCAELGWVRGRR